MTQNKNMPIKGVKGVKALAAEFEKKVHDAAPASQKSPHAAGSGDGKGAKPPAKTPPLPGKVPSKPELKQLQDDVDALAAVGQAAGLTPQDSAILAKILKEMEEVLKSNVENTKLLVELQKRVKSLSDQLAGAKLSSDELAKELERTRQAIAAAALAPLAPAPMIPDFGGRGFGGTPGYPGFGGTPGYPGFGGTPGGYPGNISPLGGVDNDEDEPGGRQSQGRHGHNPDPYDYDKFAQLLRYIVTNPKAHHHDDPAHCDMGKAEEIIGKAAICATQMPLRSLGFAMRGDGTYDVHLPDPHYTGPVLMPRLGEDRKPIYNADKQLYDILVYQNGEMKPELSFIAPDGVPPGSRSTVNPEDKAKCRNAASTAVRDTTQATIQNNVNNLEGYFKAVNVQPDPDAVRQAMGRAHTESGSGYPSPLPARARSSSRSQNARQ